jgi:hypothetical protein
MMPPIFPNEMTEYTVHCDYYGGGHTRCCLAPGHAGPHMFKCASKNCPGFAWLASNTAHPVPPCF